MSVSRLELAVPVVAETVLDNGLRVLIQEVHTAPLASVWCWYRVGSKEKARKRILLEGDPPSPLNPPKGCRFNPRCSYAVDACRATEPQLEGPLGGRLVACLRAAEI